MKHNYRIKPGSALFLLSVLALLAGCAADEPLIPPTPLTEIEQRVAANLDWTVKVGRDEQHRASYFAPAVVGQTVFAANSDGQVVALDVNSGQSLWRRSLGTRLSSGVAVDETRVYVAERDGKLLALDQASGDTVWNYYMSSEILSPVAAGFNWVVVRSADGRVVGLDAEEGVEKWRNTYAPPALTVHGYSSPRMLSDGVLLGLDDGKLVALSTATGSTLWESQLSYPSGRSEIERLVDIDANILTDSTSIYAVNYQGKLARIEPAKGRQLWSIDFSSVAGLAQTESILYAIDDTDRVLSLDKETGKVIWTQENLIGRKLTQPVVVGESLLVADLDGYLHLLSLKDGQISGRIQLSKDAVTATPVALGEGFLVQSTDGKLSRVKAAL